MDKIKNLTLPVQSRTIVISDIHGELELFKQLLNKVDFNEEDYLIINGDLCEKGRNSTEVVRYIMELSSKNPKVHVIEGNCDTLVEDLLEENPKLINYLCARKKSLLNEWLQHVGFELNEHSNVPEIKEILTKHFPEEIKWLSELPTAIETDNYIFVHAGLDNIEDWKDSDRMTAIAVPAFLEKEHRADKYVIVGHWPVGNYPSDVPANNPIINEEKKIIAIDGGNTIKSTGQLNAFIIQKTPGEDKFSHTYVGHLPTREVIKDYNEVPVMKGSINYPYYDIVPYEKSDYFTLCEQPETKQKRYVKNEYIVPRENGRFMVKTDVSCATLSVKEGDYVAVIDDSCAGFLLVKKDGKDGWIAKDCLG